MSESNNMSKIAEIKALGFYNLISFRKEKSIINKNGQDVVVFKRQPRPIADLYAELQFVASTVSSDGFIYVEVRGLSNMKLGLDFYQAVKKAGCKIQKRQFGEVTQTFENGDVEVPYFSFEVKDLVSIDKIAHVSNRFKASYEPQAD